MIVLFQKLKDWNFNSITYACGTGFELWQSSSKKMYQVRLILHDGLSECDRHLVNMLRKHYKQPKIQNFVRRLIQSFHKKDACHTQVLSVDEVEEICDMVR